MQRNLSSERAGAPRAGTVLRFVCVLIVGGLGCSRLPDTQSLTDGRCEETHKLCPNDEGHLRCVPMDVKHGCSSDACTPCYFLNAQGATCSVTGSCEPTDCKPGFARTVHGCETEIAHDVANCGVQGKRCAEGQLCIQGVCRVRDAGSAQSSPGDSSINDSDAGGSIAGDSADGDSSAGDSSVGDSSVGG